MESRVATLEERARAQGELNHTLFSKLDSIAAGVGRLETASALAVARACPAPGKCLELAKTGDIQEKKMVDLEGRLEVLETSAAEKRGSWKVIAVVGSVAGSLGSGIVWLVKHFSEHIQKL